MGRKKNTLIVAFLAFQLLLPLRYYMSSDEFDERFAWRMFSPIRMTECRVGLTEGSAGGPLRPVSVMEDVPMAWLSLMRRARVPIIRAYAEHRCDYLQQTLDEPVVRVQIQCDHPDGTSRHPIAPDENLCEARP